MACISAETGTLVFAIINIISVSMSALSGLGMFIFWLTTYLKQAVDNHKTDPECIAVFATSLTLLGGSLVSLLFSSFLLHGILKKKPQHMKAYFVFGVMKLTLTLLFVIVLLSVAAPQASVVVTALVLSSIGAVIYGLILHMIRYTYTQYQVNNEMFAHKPLA